MLSVAAELLCFKYSLIFLCCLFFLSNFVWLLFVSSAPIRFKVKSVWFMLLLFWKLFVLIKPVTKLFPILNNVIMWLRWKNGENVLILLYALQKNIPKEYRPWRAFWRLIGYDRALRWRSWSRSADRHFLCARRPVCRTSHRYASHRQLSVTNTTRSRAFHPALRWQRFVFCMFRFVRACGRRTLYYLV